MTQEELNIILEKHKKWLHGESGGERAVLRGANLICANLNHADLRKADLENANLKGANLSYADLRYADLTLTNLITTNLGYAKLHVADLSRAKIENADLSHTDLSYANLYEASLRGSILYSACLYEANLQGAYLYQTDLRDTDLSGADFELANLAEAILDDDEQIRKGICLKKPIIGYKKGRYDSVITLKIPKGAIVFSINNNKCRTNMAKVIDINNGLEEVESLYDEHFIYRKGKMVYPDYFDCQYNIECGPGIHFYRTKEKAERY